MLKTKQKGTNILVTLYNLLYVMFLCI